MTAAPRSTQPIREQLIAALVLVTSIPRPVPAALPALPAPPLVDQAGLGPVLIATCQPDQSGRVNAAALLAALGWQPGDRIDVDVVHGSVVVAAAHASRRQIGSRGDIVLPVAVRTMCRIDTGQPVLLAALIDHGLLAIHPAATITRLLARQHGRILGAIGARP